METKHARKKYYELPPDNESKILGIFTKDKDFYKTFFALMFIIGLQQLAGLMVNLIDNIMLGRYTELALSGATLVNQIQFLLQQIISCVGMGIVVLASQYWGEKRTEPIKRIISMSCKIGLLIGIFFFTVAQLMPSQILSLLTSNPSILNEGLSYLKIICWTYLIFALSKTIMYSLQSVETVMIGTVMEVSTIIINICINYCLIYGNLGFPELGIKGAAIATLISRSVELVIIIIYMLRVDYKLSMKIKEFFIWDFYYFNDYVKVATPTIISGLMWGIAQFAQSAILGHIDATTIAANSVAVIVFQVFAVFGMGCANVTSVMTGKSIGEKKFDKIRCYSKSMQGLLVIIGLVSGLLLFICRNPIIGFYKITSEAKALAVQFMTILSLTTIGTCYEYPVESGIISGGGTTEYAAITDNLFMWLFTIPFAALSAFVWHFPPVITFCFLKADQFLKCIPNAIKVNKFHWVRILTTKDVSSLP